MCDRQRMSASSGPLARAAERFRRRGPARLAIAVRAVMLVLVVALAALSDPQTTQLISLLGLATVAVAASLPYPQRLVPWVPVAEALAKRYKGLLDDIYKNGVVPEDFAIYLHHPTVTDPSMAPAGKSTFYALVPVSHMGKMPLDWDEVGPKLEKMILDELGRRLIPDIHDRIITKFSYAPKDFKLATLIKGDGEALSLGDNIVVHYSGFVWGGESFDSSWDRNQPAEFQLAESNLIKGFVKALEGQTVGSQVIAIIPPSEGYGDQGQGSIPPNSTLIFVIDILGTKKPAL
jgi:hypothetical protein